MAFWGYYTAHFIVPIENLDEFLAEAQTLGQYIQASIDTELEAGSESAIVRVSADRLSELRGVATHLVRLWESTLIRHHETDALVEFTEYDDHMRQVISPIMEVSR